MNHLTHCAIAALCFMGAPAFAEEPIQLPDSDTSSLGDTVSPSETPFFVNCATAEEFSAVMKKIKAKGVVVGDDLYDHSVLMVFKAESGSLTFARTNRDGSKVCSFAVISEYSIDHGALLRNSGEDNADDF